MERSDGKNGKLTNNVMGLIYFYSTLRSPAKVRYYGVRSWRQLVLKIRYILIGVAVGFELDSSGSKPRLVLRSLQFNPTLSLQKLAMFEDADVQ